MDTATNIKARNIMILQVPRAAVIVIPGSSAVSQVVHHPLINTKESAMLRNRAQKKVIHQIQCVMPSWLIPTAKLMSVVL